jgi:recombination protein RecR
MLFPRSLSALIGELEKLPGIGPKSAQRLAFHLLRLPQDQALMLADSIRAARQSLRFCSRCYSVSDEDLCPLCADPRRDAALVAVVAEVRDVVAMERTNEFRGLYHVLGGLISPVDGIGSKDLKVDELVARVKKDGIQEAIIATNPTLEGDTTGMYLARLLKPMGVKVTRLAYGMPVGGDLDYADQATLVSALQWRRDL